MKLDMNLLKQLRDLTSVPLQECKKALVEAEGDLDAAQEILRKNGALKAAKKADRETNEGVVKFRKNGPTTVGVKIGCETDFVAKNEQFQEIVEQIIKEIFNSGEKFDSRENASSDLQEKINEIVTAAIVTVGENLRFIYGIVTDSQAAIYNHNNNKVSAIVFFEGDDETPAKEAALQIAAMNPQFLSVDEVPQPQKDEILAGERENLEKSGKPADIIDKILEGKLLKSLSDVVLLEQEYIRDGSKKIKDIIPAGVKITGFQRRAI